MVNPVQHKNVSGIHVLFFWLIPSIRNYIYRSNNRLSCHATLFYDRWDIVFLLGVGLSVTLIYNTVVILYKQSLAYLTMAFWVVAEPFHPDILVFWAAA